MKIIHVRDDKAKGTVYYNIQDISNWNLRDLYLLLLAEKRRAETVRGFDRGSKDLLVELKKMAKERDW